jgi:hypothetical protein
MPVLLGDSLLPFRTRAERTGVIPWTGSQLISGEDAALETFAGLEAWWKQAESEWEAKRTDDNSDRSLLGQIDYMHKLRLQLPVKPHRVVYTGRGERATAARIQNPAAIVDHALYWAAFETQDEAVYVSAVINSEALHERVKDALSRGLYGGRNIHRVPFLVSWPQFDPSDDLHQGIRSAGERAEAAASALDGVEGKGIAWARKRVRGALEESGIASEIEQLVEQLLPPLDG